MKKETFKDLSIRTRMAYITAVACFVLGWAITLFNFFSTDDCSVQDSTLWILGQSLTYCGSVVGIGEFVRGEFKNFREEQKTLNYEHKNNEEEKEDCCL